MPGKKKKQHVYGRVFFVEGDDQSLATILWEIDGRITPIEGELPDDQKVEYSRCVAQAIGIRPDLGTTSAALLRYLARNDYAELKRRAAFLPPVGDNIAAPMRPLMTTRMGISRELLELGTPTRKNAKAYARLAAADAKGK